jgi:hypothetical protein
VTYAQIYGSVIANRFDASLTALVKDWIRAREGEVWQFADWPEKKTAMLNVTVTGGTATVALPAGMSWTTQEVQLFDEYGYELEYLQPEEFYRRYQPLTAQGTSQGYGQAWTLTTDAVAGTLQIRIGPTPSSSKTYTVRGWTLPIKRTAAATWAPGTMSADTDLPWWPDDYHFFLVEGAAALGGKLLGDLDYDPLEADFQAGLRRLRKELCRREIRVWGESSYGGYSPYGGDSSWQ